MNDLFGGDLPLGPRPGNELLVLQEITPEELGLRFARDGQFDEVVADSRKIAKKFGKRHDNVMHTINVDLQSISLDLRRSFYREATYIDERGRTYPCFDLTKRGAMLLCSQYDRMLAVAVIITFEKMANELGERADKDVQYVSDVLEAAMQRWHDRVEQTIVNTVKQAIADIFKQAIKQTIAPVVEGVEWIQAFLNRSRQKISDEVQRTHRAVIQWLGGNCPCCGIRKILDSDGQVLLNEKGIAVADYDHAKQSATADLHHTWLICSRDKDSCHYRLTHGPEAREYRLKWDHAFCTYQRRVLDYLESKDLQKILPFEAIIQLKGKKSL